MFLVETSSLCIEQSGRSALIGSGSKHCVLEKVRGYERMLSTSAVSSHSGTMPVGKVDLKNAWPQTHLLVSELDCVQSGITEILCTVV